MAEKRVILKSDKPTRRSFSERMVEYGEIDQEFAVFESDIGYSTYSYLFGEKFPDRYFNCGVAEIGTMAAAAGMSCSGRNVVVCGYGVFLTMRSLEIVRTFICYPDLNVKLLSSHGGLTAAIDGTTHQATEDIGFMSTLPNMKIFVPADHASSRKIFDLTMKTPGPVFTRLMRDPLWNIYTDEDEFTSGGSHRLKEGKDITIISYGDIVFQALQAAEDLEKRGISAEVIDMYSVKPFDQEAVSNSVRKTKALLVAENHQTRNGLAYDVGIFCLKSKLSLVFDQLGLEEKFGETGDYFKVIDKYGFSARCIAEKAVEILKNK